MSHTEINPSGGGIVARLRTGAIRVFLASAVITAFVGNAVVVDGARLSLNDNAAFARGGGGGGGHGGGHGGGRGGGHGGGHGKGHGGHGVDHGEGPKGGHVKGLGHGHDKGHAPGRGHARSHGLGHAKGHHGGDGESAHAGHRAPVVDKSFHASALGSLNAAHASPTAFANAAPNSKVGQIAAFARAVENDPVQVEDAAQALAAAANKPVTEDVVTEVARLADVEVSEQAAKDIADRAAAIQSGEN